MKTMIKNKLHSSKWYYIGSKNTCASLPTQISSHPSTATRELFSKMIISKEFWWPNLTLTLLSTTSKQEKFCSFLLLGQSFNQEGSFLCIQLKSSQIWWPLWRQSFSLGMIIKLEFPYVYIHIIYIQYIHTTVVLSHIYDKTTVVCIYFIYIYIYLVGLDF